MASRGLAESNVAVAVNGEIVPRGQWQAVALAEGDQVAVTCQDTTRDPAPVGVEKLYRIQSGLTPSALPGRQAFVWDLPVALTTEQ